MLVFFILFYIIISLISSQIEKKSIKNNVSLLRKLNDEAEIEINSINKKILVGENGCIFISNYLDENVESKKENNKEKYVYALKNNGRGYYK